MTTTDSHTCWWLFVWCHLPWILYGSSHVSRELPYWGRSLQSCRGIVPVLFMLLWPAWCFCPFTTGQKTVLTPAGDVVAKQQTHQVWHDTNSFCSHHQQLTETGLDNSCRTFIEVFYLFLKSVLRHRYCRSVLSCKLIHSGELWNISGSF